MPRKSIHWRAVKDYPSFPNNRRSTRFSRRKVVTKRVWKEEESPAYFGVPDTALFTPWDVLNPTNQAPALKNYHTIHYSDAGGYAPAQPCPEMFASQFGGFCPPGLNAEEYLSNQFNPFVKENTPPVITRVEIDTWDDWGWCGLIPVVEASWSKIDLYAMDLSDFTVRMGVKDRNRYVEFNGQGGGIERHFTTTIEIDYWADSLAEYYVNATLTDTAGNRAYYEKEVAGFFGDVMNFLGDVWNGICGVFSAAWEAVKSAVNILGKIIIGTIHGLLSPILTPIQSGIFGLIERIMNAVNLDLTDGFTLAKSGTPINEIKFSRTEDAFLALLPMIIAFGLGISLAMYVVNLFVVSMPFLIPLITLLGLGLFSFLIDISNNSDTSNGIVPPSQPIDIADIFGDLSHNIPNVLNICAA